MAILNLRPLLVITTLALVSCLSVQQEQSIINSTIDPTMAPLSSQSASEDGNNTKPTQTPLPQITIWNLGDSVTDGAGSPSTGQTHSGGFRLSMIQSLLSSGLDPILYGSVPTEQPSRIPPLMNTPSRIYHEGHNGVHIADLAKFAPEWLSHSPSLGGHEIFPKYVTLMVGTNNIGRAYGVAHDSVPPGRMDELMLLPQMQNDLRELVTTLARLRPDAHVFVASIIPAYWALGMDHNITGSAPWPGVGAPEDRTDYLLNHYVRVLNEFIGGTLVPELMTGRRGRQRGSSGGQLGLLYQGSDGKPGDDDVPPAAAASLERGRHSGAGAGLNVSFVDIYAEFIGKNDEGNKIILENLFGDITHPNTEGFDRIGKAFAKAIISKEKAARSDG